MIGAIMILGLFALITVLPIKLAADFTDGTNTGLFASTLAAIVAPALSLLTYRLVFGGFTGFVLAFLVGIAAYVTVLRIPARTIVGFAVIAVALQVAVFGALVSFGVNIGRMLHP
jgi:hypothetical protein